MTRELGLVCVVPVYNEADILETAIVLLAATFTQQRPSLDWQIVIASNGSTDQTNHIGRQLEQRFDGLVRLIICRQRGRGAALREVFGQVKANRYMFIDVDLPCDLEDIPRLLAPLGAGIDLVVSRRTGYRPVIRRAMTIALRTLNFVWFRERVSDSQCALKALSPRAASVLANDCHQNGWYLDTELIVMSHARGLTRAEVPITWKEQRFHGRSSKVAIWSDSMKAAHSLLQIWLQRRRMKP